MDNLPLALVTRMNHEKMEALPSVDAGFWTCGAFLT